MVDPARREHRRGGVGDRGDDRGGGGEWRASHNAADAGDEQDRDREQRQRPRDHRRHLGTVAAERRRQRGDQAAGD